VDAALRVKTKSPATCPEARMNPYSGTWLEHCDPGQDHVGKDRARREYGLLCVPQRSSTAAAKME